MTTQALFFDIDGTLVSFRTQVIPDSTVWALRAAKARGIKVFISTGRPVQFIVNLGQISDLIDGYVTTNGAYCFVGREQVACHALLADDVDELMTACRQFDVPAVVCGRDSVSVFQPAPIVDRTFREGLGLNDFRFDHLEHVLTQPILQFTPFFSPEQEAEVMPRLQACNSGRWTPLFTDITHLDADKGKGLCAMAYHLGIPVEATMAFGDGGNDISIIRQAGIGVAMGNAGDDVKTQADYVTNNVDDDGVYKALVHFQLIEGEA